MSAHPQGQLVLLPPIQLELTDEERRMVITALQRLMAGGEAKVRRDGLVKRLQQR